MTLRTQRSDRAFVRARWVVTFVVVTLSVMPARAQQAHYKGAPIRSGEIILVSDREVESQQKASFTRDWSARFEATPEPVRSGGFERWRVPAEQLELAIEAANAQSGFKAFPNYVFQRETPGAGERLSIDRSREGAPDEPYPTTRQSSTPIPVGPATSGGQTLWTEDFENGSAATLWTVGTYDGLATANWQINGRLEVGNPASPPAAYAYSSARATFSTTDLDPTLTYVLSADFDAAFVGDGFLAMAILDPLGNTIHYRILADAENPPSGAISIEQAISGIGSQASFTLEFIFYSEAGPSGAGGAWIDNLQLRSETPLLVNDYLSSLQWYLDDQTSDSQGPDTDLNMSAAWQVASDQPVNIVVVDDGIDIDHPDLTNRIWVNPGEDLNNNGRIDGAEYNGVDDDGNGYVDDFHGWSPIYSDNSTLNEGSYHGTHVAGIIGAQAENGIGVAGLVPQARLISVMIFDAYGRTDAAAVLDAFTYISSLLAQGIEIPVINQSWGGALEYAGGSALNAFIETMTQHAYDHATYDAAWVVAAGNDGLDRDDLRVYSFPNDIQSPNVLTVAATNEADQLSVFSDFGRRTVDIGAPGSDIVSTYPDGRYATLSGTSMAAPMVSAALALAAGTTNEDHLARSVRILATGKPLLGELDQKTVTGKRLNVGAALDLTSTPLIPSGVVITPSGVTQGQYSIDDPQASFVAGFINNTGQPITVTGVTISDDPPAGEPSAASTYTFSPGTTPIGATYQDGETFAGAITYTGTSTTPGTDVVTLTFQTSFGDITETLDFYQKGYSILSMSVAPHVDLGRISEDASTTHTFDLTATGSEALDYQLAIRLEQQNNALNALVRPLIPTLLGKTASASRGNTQDIPQDRSYAPFETGDGPPSLTLPTNGQVVLYAEDFEGTTAGATPSDWTLSTTSESHTDADGWHVTTITDPSTTAENNVLVAGAFGGAGYQDGLTTSAIMPSFDLSSYALGTDRRLVLAFDYVIQLEANYDVLYVDVYSSGDFLETIAISDGELQNNAGAYRAAVDVSSFFGLSEVNFVFYVETDGMVSEGFGALLDNVQLRWSPIEIESSLVQGRLDVDSPQTISFDYNGAYSELGTTQIISTVSSGAIAGTHHLRQVADVFVHTSAYTDSLFWEHDDLFFARSDGAKSLDLSVDNSTDKEIISFELNIRYDPAVVSIALSENTTPSGLDETWYVLSRSTTPGQLSVAAAGVNAIKTGQSDFLRLDVTPLAPGTTGLTIDGFINNINNYFVERSGTEVTVYDADYGDVDGSNGVRAFDASLVLRYTVGLDEGIMPLLADVDASGESNSVDASYILQYLVGGIDCLPVLCTSSKGFAPSWASTSVSLSSGRHVDDAFRIPVRIEPGETPVYAVELILSGLEEAGAYLRTESLPAGWVVADRPTPDGAQIALAGSRPLTEGLLAELVFDVPSGHRFAGKPSFIARVNGHEGDPQAMPVEDHPNTTALAAIFPNPFQQRATVRFDLSTRSTVDLRVIDVLGRTVATITKGVFEPGNHLAHIDGSALSSGLYFIELRVPNRPPLIETLVKL